MTNSTPAPEQPAPRSEPLIIDHIPPDTRLAITEHGGTCQTLADGGYQIVLPPGTLQWRERERDDATLYALQFPDGTLFRWFRKGRFSRVTGWPQHMQTGLALA